MSEIALPTRRLATAESRTVRAAAPVRYLVAAIALFIAALMIAPVALSFFASIKTSADAVAIPPTYLPPALSLENYWKIIHYQAGLWTYVSNSLIVAVIGYTLLGEQMSWLKAISLGMIVVGVIGLNLAGAH